MKLVDLDPSWLGAGGAGITDKDGNPVPERHGVALAFDCPCGRRDYDNGHTPRLAIHISPALDNGPDHSPQVWHRTGDTFETLTLTPSILRIGGCAWHGFITNGEIRSC